MQCSLALQNCTFKRSRNKCEIHVDKNTSVILSPKKFKVTKESVLKVTCSPNLATLEEVKDVAEQQQITVLGKVQSVATIEQVLLKTTGKQLSKQEILFADCTAACWCVLWEQHVNGVEEDYPQMFGFAKCGQFTATTSTR